MAIIYGTHLCFPLQVVLILERVVGPVGSRVFYASREVGKMMQRDARQVRCVQRDCEALTLSRDVGWASRGTRHCAGQHLEPELIAAPYAPPVCPAHSTRQPPTCTHTFYNYSNITKWPVIFLYLSLQTQQVDNRGSLSYSKRVIHKSLLGRYFL